MSEAIKTVVDWQSAIEMHARHAKANVTAQDLNLRPESADVQMARLGLLTVRSQEGRVTPHDGKTSYPRSAPLMAHALKSISNAHANATATATGEAVLGLYRQMGGTFGKPLPTPYVHKERAYIEAVTHVWIAALLAEVFGHTDKVLFGPGAAVPVRCGHSMGIDHWCASMLPGWVPSNVRLDSEPDCQPDEEKRVQQLLARVMTIPTSSSSGSDAQKANVSNVSNQPNQIDVSSLVRVCVFDPTWGRAAKAPDGLFSDILFCLNHVHQCLQMMETGDQPTKPQSASTPDTQHKIEEPQKIGMHMRFPAETRYLREDVVSDSKRSVNDDKPRPTIHKIHLSAPWYELVKSGKKKYEGRLWAYSVPQWRVGDYLNIFQCTRIRSSQAATESSSAPKDASHSTDGGNKMHTPAPNYVARITSVQRFGTFEEALNQLPLSEILPGIETVEEGVKVYEKFVTIATQKQKGVCMVGVEPLDPPPYVVS